jgi:hypothetical protein
VHFQKYYKFSLFKYGKRKMKLLYLSFICIILILTFSLAIARRVANYEWCDFPPESEHGVILNELHVIIPDSTDGAFKIGVNAKVGSAHLLQHPEAFFNTKIWNENNGNVSFNLFDYQSCPTL